MVFLENDVFWKVNLNMNGFLKAFEIWLMFLKEQKKVIDFWDKWLKM